jgi:hypothetical protein
VLCDEPVPVALIESEILFTTPKLREHIWRSHTPIFFFFLFASGPLVSEGPDATIVFACNMPDGLDTSSLKIYISNIERLYLRQYWSYKQTSKQELDCFCLSCS